MTLPRLFAPARFLGLILFCIAANAASQTDATWLPISSADLALKDNPAHPGDSAMILYQEILTDNTKSTETHYTRIKILKEDGKKYADIEIPYFEKRMQVDNIRARTVAPDGQATEFAGTIFEKVLVKTRRYKVNVKTFTLPNVQAGGIIECFYRLRWHESVPNLFKNPENYLIDGIFTYPAAQWTLEQDLFVRRAHLTLRPLPRARVEFWWSRLPKGTQPLRQPDGTIQLDAENIPAFHDEEYSPPEATLKARVEVFYALGFLSSAESYWADLAKRRSEGVQKFIGRSKGIERETQRILSSSDSSETKLRKLYTRAQQIRYLSYEPERTEKEHKQENLKVNKSAEDVLTRGYAFANDINYLFVALARAAGFEAYLVEVASRNQNFFQSGLLDPDQLNALVVEVHLGSQVLFLDPATLHCPFGLLPWEETDTQGIRLDSIHPAYVKTPPSKSADAVSERKAGFKLGKDGKLRGELEITFRGQEALQRKLQAVNQDDAARRKDLEEEVKSWLPPGSSATLSSVNGLAESEAPLEAKLAIEAPNLAMQVGQRLLLPFSVFQRRGERSFQASHREHPIYFAYPHQRLDELTVEIPSGYDIETLPSPRKIQEKFGSYEISAEKQATAVLLKRHFTMDGFHFQVENYPTLRSFYDRIRTNDEEQAILHVIPAGPGR